MDEQSASHTIRLAPGVHLPRSALQYQFVRSSGPGGQNVNKLNTKAQLTVALDDLEAAMDPGSFERLKRLAGRYLAEDRLVLESQAHRSQIANRDACLEKLGDLVKRARHKPKPRRPTRPTRASRERRIDHKKRRGQIKRNRKPPPKE
jgi:ribosome-associated protein